MEHILFIDGENFKKKLATVFYTERKQRPQWNMYDFSGLFNHVLEGIRVDRKIFYAAKLVFHQKTEEKSRLLIEEQRHLKTHLEKQGFDFIFGGRVRGNAQTDSAGKQMMVFKEKGVDVQIAVDMTKKAYRKELASAILASSDSDLQPAIRAMKECSIPCIYLGFELEPNKGLTYTTKRTILIRNSEVLRFAPQTLLDR